MNQGILIFAHNSRVIDYARLAVIAGGLAKKHLNKPASLVTDKTTYQWIVDSELKVDVEKVFENVLFVEKPGLDNQRTLHDGDRQESIPFFNKSRSNAYELTPYDQTLLLDSDFLIFSDVLNNYWGNELAISTAVQDVYYTNRFGYHDRYISDTGIKMYWATTFMFSKTPLAKVFFELVTYIKQNYRYYADIFRFDSKQFRNDIAFSIAKHILDGYAENTSLQLPPVKTAMDKDILHAVSDSGRLDFLIASENFTNYSLSSFTDVDLHVMNKQSIIRNYNQLRKLL